MADSVVYSAVVKTQRVPAGRIIVALTAGAIITVALSWLAMFLPLGNAWYGPPTVEDLGLGREEDEGYYKYWQLTQGTNAWHRVISYWHMQISGQSLMIPLVDYDAQKLDFDTLPEHLQPESLSDLYMQAWYHETGFPFPAMTCSVQWNTQISNSDIIYDVHGGYQLNRDQQFNPRALPLRPVWPGFAANVLIWGACAYLMSWGAQTLRRRLRARKGGCRTCGYPRTGLPKGSRCPECGSGPDADALQA